MLDATAAAGAFLTELRNQLDCCPHRRSRLFLCADAPGMGQLTQLLDFTLPRPFLLNKLIFLIDNNHCVVKVKIKEMDKLFAGIQKVT